MMRDTEVTVMYNGQPLGKVVYLNQSIDKRYVVVESFGDKQKYIVDLTTEEAYKFEGNEDKFYNTQYKFSEVTEDTLKFTSTKNGEVISVKLGEKPGFNLRQAQVTVQYPFIDLNNYTNIESVDQPKNLKSNMQIEVKFSNTYKFIEIETYVLKSDLMYDRRIFIYDLQKKQFVLDEFKKKSYLYEWSPDDRYVVISTHDDIGSYLVEFGNDITVSKSHGGYWLSNELQYAGIKEDSKYNFYNLTLYNVKTKESEYIKLPMGMEYYNDVVKNGDRYLSIITKKTNLLASIITVFAERQDKFLVTQETSGSRLKTIKLKSGFGSISAQFYSPDGKYLYYNTEKGLRKVKV